MNIVNYVKRIYNKEYEKIQLDVFGITDQKKYAICQTKLLLRFEGMRHRHKNKKSFNNIDLSKYLDEIKDAENENALIIAIKDSVVETLRLSGDENSISVESYFTKRPNMVSAVEFIAKWSKYGAQICNYHNHPLCIAAIPSNQDIESMECPQSHGNWDEYVKKYSVDIPHDFHFADWGVITSYDFFSKKQYEENGGRLSDICEQNKFREKITELKLKKYKIE